MTAQDTGAGEPGLGVRWDQDPTLAWPGASSVYRACERWRPWTHRDGRDGSHRRTGTGEMVVIGAQR